MVKICPDAFGESSFSLYQVYLAAGLASLLQVRVTELPSTISAEGLTDTEGSLGPSGGEHVQRDN